MFLLLSALALILEALVLWGGLHLGGFHPAWIAVALSAPSSVVPGVSELIRHRRLTSELLVAIAIVASLCIGEVFAAAEVAFLMNLGEFLEDVTVRRSRRGLRALASVVPKTACRVRAEDGAEESVDAADIHPGDLLRVRPGEAFPTDGTIADGETSVDQSVLTGESLPVDKTVGDTVYCGTLNKQGSVDVTATSAAGESSLQKMLRLAEEAEEGKAPIQTTADRWAERLVPAALALALAVFLAGAFLFGLPLREAALRGVTILVVFCPCALVLATPTALMAAIGHASRNGVIVKSGAALEALARVSRLALDKTGTLTEGRLRVAECSLSPDDLALVAAVESRSEHPLARAVCQFAGSPAENAADSETGKPENRKTGELQARHGSERIAAFRAVPGMGVEATVDGHRVRIGVPERLHLALTDSLAEAIGRARNDGHAVLVAEIDGRVAGHAALSDTLRPGARETIDALASLGMPATLLSGDHAAAATAIARSCGIDDVRGDLLPQDKAVAIRTLQSQGARIAMVGDGVNDAISLRTADVGIAMASLGSDAAVESADIALLGDDLSRLPYLRRLACATVRTITLGIAFSMGINLVAVTLSALGLLGPVAGALVHNIGSVVVVSSAALLYDRKIA